MQSVNIYSFADKVSADSRLRAKLVKAYAEAIFQSMTTEEIIEDWKINTESDIREDMSYNGCDTVIQEISERMPELLEKEFGVDVSMFS